MAKLISGKELAARVKQEVAQEVQALRQKQITVRLAVIIVGENPASMTYVAGKARDCEACGIESDVIRLPEQTTEAELLEVSGVGQVKASRYGPQFLDEIARHIQQNE